MDIKQDVRQTVEESVPNPPDASQCSRSGEDAHINPNPAGDAVTLIAQTYSSSTEVEELEARAEVSLLSIASGGLQGEVNSVPLPSGSQVPTIGDPGIPQKSLPGPSFAIEGAVESSPGNPITLAGDVVNAIAIGSTEDIKDKAQVLVLARLRSTVSVYAAKLPVVGSHFTDTRHVGEPDVDTFATETTPLLGAFHDPKAFAIQQTEGLLCRLLSPLLNRLPDVDTLDKIESDDHGPFFKIFVECYVLARDGGGWLL